MRSLLLLATLCQLIVTTLAVSIRISIPPSTLLPNPNVLPASTHATLSTANGPELKAIIRKGNYIEFPSIPTSGSHLLNIYSRDYTFAPYRIDISPTTSEITGAFESYRGTQWSDHGVALTPGGEPTKALTLTAKVLAKKQFYETRQGFSVMSLLKNPMILMGVVALGFTFGMPKLMESMDPEMKAEYEEMQKKSPVASITRAMQGGGGGGDGFDVAGFLAGSGQQSSGGGATSGSTKGSGDIRERKR